MKRLLGCLLLALGMLNAGNAHAAWTSLGLIRNVRLSQIDGLGMCSYRLSFPWGVLQKEKVSLASVDRGPNGATFTVELNSDGGFASSEFARTLELKLERDGTTQPYTFAKRSRIAVSFEIPSQRIALNIGNESSGVSLDLPITYPGDVYLEKNCS